MRILFITANRLGDAVLSTGLLDWLTRQHPTAQFTVVCGPVAADLFRTLPRLERLIVMRKRKWNGHWLGLWRECVGTRWDLIVDLRNSVVSRLLCAASRAYRPPHNTGQHKVRDNAAALRLDPPPSPCLWLDDAARDAAAALLQGSGPILALGPSANWPCKQWPVENFTALAQQLTAPDGPIPNARILVVAAPHERAQIASLLDALPPAQVIDGIGQNLLTVAACLSHATLFVGNDSGLMHMAAAVGTRTLGLFGPGYEQIYGPWGPKTAFIRTPESAKELLARLPHPSARAPNLMQSLSVERVYQAAEALIGTA